MGKFSQAEIVLPGKLFPDSYLSTKTTFPRQRFLCVWNFCGWRSLCVEYLTLTEILSAQYTFAGQRLQCLSSQSLFPFSCIWLVQNIHVHISSILFSKSVPSYFLSTDLAKRVGFAWWPPKCRERPPRRLTSHTNHLNMSSDQCFNVKSEINNFSVYI